MAKTALDLTDEEIQSYSLIKHLAKWETEERREKALEIAKAIAKLLRKEFGATKVVLFGSIVYPERFSPWSDIDIAVYGIRADQFYKAVAASFEIAHDFHIDIVDPIDCYPPIREDIELNGIEI
jgi:predicted nucleotidyltransferase